MWGVRAEWKQNRINNRESTMATPTYPVVLTTQTTVDRWFAKDARQQSEIDRLEHLVADMDNYNHDANLRIADLMEQNEMLSDRIELDLNPRIKMKHLLIDRKSAAIAILTDEVLELQDIIRRVKKEVA